jgi:uncharacterized protein YukE
MSVRRVPPRGQSGYNYPPTGGYNSNGMGRAPAAQGQMLGMTHLDNYSPTTDPQVLLQENGQLKITNTTLKKALDELRTQMSETEKHRDSMMKMANERYQSQIADLSRRVHALTQVLNNRLQLSREENAILEQTAPSSSHMNGAYNMPGYYAPRE